ncbi:hypothetical protein LEP1GSC132_2765 [Leptospira kirschneri str. 200803703]|nr:hypothetical protein LEP1GSC132_2765 [Leptospira kirschneri str. 200803703]
MRNFNRKFFQTQSLASIKTKKDYCITFPVYTLLTRVEKPSCLRQVWILSDLFTEDLKLSKTLFTKAF